MPPDTQLSDVLAHISNSSCSNVECPSAIRATSSTLQQNPKNIVSHTNSVWKAELRVRYIPKSMRELYETNRTTCHFYFEQVTGNLFYYLYKEI